MTSASLLIGVMLMVTMSRLLSDLLGTSGPLFAQTVDRLERSSGQQSVDVRLSADIVSAVHVKTRALGLDPHDTNGRELYHALLDLVRIHDEFLVRHLGGKDPGAVADLLPRIVHVAERIRMPRSVWAIKHSVAKRLLRAQPPKRLLKILGYRSPDSLIKREPMGEVFAALRFAESPEWQEQFVRRYEKLSPSDFEQRNIEITLLDGKRWGKAAEALIRRQHHNITHSKEMGSIIVLPLPIERLPGLTITALPLLLHYMNELRVYSAFFKLQQVKPSFGAIVAQTILHDPGDHATIAGQNIHWRTIHRHFGNMSWGSHPEVLEPHVQADDLEWRQAEEVLFRLEPALQFWHGLDYVATIRDGQMISFNLMDVATNYINQLPFEKQVNYHQQKSLWNELHMRYIGQPALELQVLRQLDNDTFEPNTVMIGGRR